MGYLVDQKGIYNRFIRENKNWNEHINNTRDYISDFILRKESTEVAFLGSGWLLDLPMDFLIAKNISCSFYDIWHPSLLLKKFKDKPNFKFINYDLSGGGIEFIYNLVKEYKKSGTIIPITDMNLRPLKTDKKKSLIISVNILNQLDILLIDYLKNYKIAENYNIENLRKTIQEHHINDLKTGLSCIITDFREKIFDKKNNLEASNPLLYSELPKGENRKEWIWEFDIHGKYYQGKKVEFDVVALEI